jgi:DNA helicase INO80
MHNWYSELQKFCPQMKVIPYFGANPNERKLLRRMWTNPADLGTPEAAFHVLVTNYKLVIADEKHFARVKWQYMVLDEAQAVKNSASQRWKTLLGFNCRNRLLLTGTPIQVSDHDDYGYIGSTSKRHISMPKPPACSRKSRSGLDP